MEHFFHGQCAAVPALAGVQGANLEKMNERKKPLAMNHGYNLQQLRHQTNNHGDYIYILAAA